MTGAFRVGNWEVFPDAGTVQSGDKKVQLQPKVMDLLVYLAEHRGEVLPKERLIQALWPDMFVTDEVLTNSIWKLRQAFEDDTAHASYLETIPRRGYRLIADVVYPEEAETPSDRYQLVRQLSSRPMGEVYLARDTLLHRDVALKFVSGEIEEDARWRKRLLREARAAASLDHPYICKVYDWGRLRDRTFIAMEYVAGRTLRERLRNGPLEAEEALGLALEIAEALEAAHKRNIVHRDIKPSNIMLAEQGHVKLLDFGVAKRLPNPGEEADWTTTLMEEPSNTGTLAYMSPEQLKGQDVDTRSDIFSFGVVLYELLTGVHPFRTGTQAEIISAILGKQPSPISHYREETSEPLERTVARMLAKPVEERYQAVHEVRADLEAALSRLNSTGESLPSKTWMWGVGLALILAAAGIYWLNSSFPRQEGVSTPLSAVPLTSYPGEQYWASFSPDGRQVAFDWNGNSGDNFDIYVRFISEEMPLRLTTDPAVDCCPVWSPEGSRIVFSRASDGIYSVSPLGGSERRLYAFRGSAHPTMDWSPDGRFVAFSESQPEDPEGPPRIFLLSVETREKQPLTSPPYGLGDVASAFSPDGKTLAFTRDRKHICLVSVEGGEPRVLFDVNGLLIGNRLTWTPDGSEIVFSVGLPVGGDSSLWRVSVADGTSQRLAVGGDNARYPTLSRQGDLLAYMQGFWRINIWQTTRPAQGDESPSPTRLIASTRVDSAPQFSPDGKRIAFQSERSGHHEVWVSQSDGSNPFPLTSLGSLAGFPNWSPDGRNIVFAANTGFHVDVFVVDADGGQPRRLTSERADHVLPSWSHDNRWIYFGSDKGGDFQVWRIPAEGGEAIQVTVNGGCRAIESSDGKFLYYTHSPFAEGVPGIWRVPVEGGDEVLVLESFQPNRWGSWAVVETGIYYVNLDGEPGPRIEFFDFAANSSTPVVTLDKPPPSNLVWDGLAVSQDEERFLYLREDEVRSNLMLVRDFH